MRRQLRKSGTPVRSGGGRIVLVGTYKGDQLTAWQGWYNYPISADDKISAEDAAKITELWLFKGVEEERHCKAEFIGIKTRRELIDDYAYPARGKAHGEKYLLFKTEQLYRSQGDVPKDADRVIIRTADFATAPKVRKQLKAYLESPDRSDPNLAKRLPELITRLRPEQLRVGEAVCQMSLEDLPTGKDFKLDVPFPPPTHPRFTFIDRFSWPIEVQVFVGNSEYAQGWRAFQEERSQLSQGYLQKFRCSTNHTLGISHIALCTSNDPLSSALLISYWRSLLAA